MDSRRLLLARVLMLALALATVLGLSSAQAKGAKTNRAGDTCAEGASSTRATVRDGQVAPAPPPATTGCTSR